MIVLLLGTHLFLTIRLKFPQRYLLKAIRLSVSKDKNRKSPEGRVVEILNHNLRTLVGTIQVFQGFSFVVPDNKKISRAKLAYIIDSTAAPICIIMPISSWAAAVSSYVESDNGFKTFIKAIPYNYYALFTIIALFTVVLLNVDFGPMKRFEANAAKENSFSTNEIIPNSKGTTIDFFFAIACIILCCVIGMIYTGGFFDGKDIMTAFANSDASFGLMLGGFFAFLITSIFYSLRKVVKYKDISKTLPDGITSMVPSILILVFAWTLKAITDGLGLSGFVSSIIVSLSTNVMNILPALIFLIAALLAFATGTSWGIFGILIPIIVSAFNGQSESFLIISISACMAGAVCGDHCSPISDTTIMASAGAKCDHIQHVSSQLPYVIVVAIISSLAYIIVGYFKNPIPPLIFGFVAIIGTFFGIKKISNLNLGLIHPIHKP